MNKVILYGRLARDPEVTHISSGTAVCNFTVATDSSVKQRDGKWKKEVDYHRVQAWAKRGETIGQYFSKGDAILVTGKLKTRSYEKGGEKRYVTEVVLEDFEFGAKQDKQASFEGMGEKSAQQNEPSQDFDDDIPF